jgi:hypothetical protein
MKDFYEVDDWQQCELLFELIERIGANDVRSLEELSEKEGKAPHVIWTEMQSARDRAMQHSRARIDGWSGVVRCGIVIAPRSPA